MNELKNSDKLWISGWFCLLITINYFIAKDYVIGFVWLILWIICTVVSKYESGR